LANEKWGMLLYPTCGDYNFLANRNKKSPPLAGL
jgi:hypothetical protein